MNISGRCLCGAVTFVAEEVEKNFHACHCDMCRRWCGGPALATYVAKVTFAGEDSLCRFKSSKAAERGFCTKCGTNLFYYHIEAAQYAMWVGTFDDQAPFTLGDEIFIDEKPASYAFSGEHPRMTGAEFIASLTDPEA